MTTDVPVAVAKLRGIIAHCDTVMARFGPASDMQLILPGKWGGSPYKRLWGKGGGPKGRIITDTVGAGRVLVTFRADEVRQACQEMLGRLEP